MIAREKVKSLVIYLNNYKRDIHFNLIINTDGFWEAIYKKETWTTGKIEYYNIKILNKKTYKNSSNKEFIVYLAERYIDDEFQSSFKNLR